jgi:hypothetical protein
MVVLWHIAGQFGLPPVILGGWPLTGGVSFFFILSGFILTHAHLNMTAGGTPFSFYVSRIARIWPAHVACFLLLFILVALREMDPSEAVAPLQIEDALYAHFEVLETFDRGGTLLMPIFGSACLSSAMAEDEDGLHVLQRLFDTERALICGGIIKSLNRQYIAGPRQ